MDCVDASPCSGNGAISPATTLLDAASEASVQNCGLATEIGVRASKQALEGAKNEIRNDGFSRENLDSETDDIYWFSGPDNASKSKSETGFQTDMPACIDFGINSEFLLPEQFVDVYLNAVSENASVQRVASSENALSIKQNTLEMAGQPTQGQSSDVSVLDALLGCEPNLIRAPDDMYTPRWIRGIGKEKEGLCSICFSNGTLKWRRMKCSAYW
ncbi:hypothetical protein COEREDRAFT_84646 [Coemansia reversa NRRL 1564]|uniref:Transcription regulator Rua1 C-terminal domain-containing protein n=1 Tax=Coemansia reversa (strain ATCC 12441 / NRRL 1564) TaxID=763665 RepID=A0A2G5BKQ9_COERN|nr:hypothetical protein COEREDRAFT_84646 [Coemansia reversa NRRL 1564]|eukprot:PIA19347.1 hypothetical protein COEREDRAFT_84646 [Coemansia reversa NRRL 1564]